jgi:hypothetical protein
MKVRKLAGLRNVSWCNIHIALMETSADAGCNSQDRGGRLTLLAVDGKREPRVVGDSSPLSVARKDINHAAGDCGPAPSIAPP